MTVSSLTGVTAISAGGMHSLALKSNGTVWGWGDGSSGQLGNSSTAEHHTPVQTTATNLGAATAISAGSTFSEALKSDGTVWTWGANSKGQLGNNATGLQSAPVQVSSLTGATAISAGFQHALAVKSNGTVWAWGLNANGELGNNSTTDSRVPVQVSGITTATQAAAGNNFSSLRKSDGTVWSWGADANGRLGDNATTDQHTPVQTGTITVASIEDGSSHGTAVKSDGTVWTWGWNHDGQLGNNTTTESHIPIQTSNLPGTATSATYSYDGTGLRTSKTVNGTTTTYTWDKSGSLPLLVAETTGGNTTRYIYGPGGLPIEDVQPNGTTTRYYHHDQLGGTRLLTDSSGTVVSTTTFDAYGKLAAATGTATTPLGYAGQYTDLETGFQYLRARYYDSNTGVFVTRDPAEATTRSAYGYTDGSPLNSTDPSGLLDFDVTLDTGISLHQIGDAFSQMGKCITGDAGCRSDTKNNAAVVGNVVNPTVSARVCSFACLELTGQLLTGARFRYGFGWNMYAGIGVGPTGDPACRESDEFFGGYDVFGGSLARSKTPGDTRYGPWKANGSFGPSFGGGFVHWIGCVC